MERNIRVAACMMAVMLLLMGGCKAEKGTEADTGSAAETTGGTGRATEAGNAEDEVRITQTAAGGMQLENYETSDFSITIPKGWKVTAGGTGIHSYVFVNDPDEPRNTMFFVLKMEPLLHSQAGKDVWQKMYNSGDPTAAQFAQAAVLENPSTEGLCQTIYPDFTVTDRFAAQNGYGAFSLGDEILRAVFTDEAGPAEGMFTASVVDFGSFPISDGTVIDYQLQTVDGGYYMAYNVTGITAARDTLLEWSEVLFRCLASLKYTDSFIRAVNQASDDQLALSNQISQNFNQTMDGLMSSWENRNKSQDILSQK